MESTAAPSPAASATATLSRIPAWLLLLLVSAMLFIPGTRAIPLMDRDEPRFAHATMEMMQRDEWFIPYFNGEYRFDKPPLTYWWMRLHYSLLGFNELAARLHSAVAAWLVAVVVFSSASRLWSRQAGWWAALGWLTSLQVLIHGRLCVADMPMVLCVTLMMTALSNLLLPEQAPARKFSLDWWMLWLAAGAGFLAKGPIALLVPALALLLWRWAFWRKPVPWNRLQIGWGLLIALALVAAWGVPALMQTKGLFWKVGMGEHVVKRGTQAFNGRVVLPFYYFATAFLSLLPWIAFLPLVWRRIRTTWSSGTALLCAWFTAPYLIFLLYATQLPHYVMPGFPAFFLLLGAALSTKEGTSTTRWGAYGWAYTLLMSLVAVAALVLALNKEIVPVASFQWVMVSGAALLLSLLLLGFAASRRWFPLMAFASVIAAGSLIPFGKCLRAEHLVIKLAPSLQSVAKDKDLIAWGFTEPSLVFYTDRKWNMLSKMDRVKERLAKGRAGAVVVLKREWTLSDKLKHWRNGQLQPPTKDNQITISDLLQGLPGAKVVEASGYNLARSSWVELQLIIPQDGQSKGALAAGGE